MSERHGTNLSIPSLLIALLAVIGVVNLPVRQPGLGGQAANVGGETPQGAEAERSGGSDSSDRGGAPIEPTDELLLRVLAPLKAFHGGRLANLGDSERTPAGLVGELLSGQTGVDLEFLIMTVPHPTRSGVAFRFDSSMLALQMAMRHAGYVLDGHRIPWAPPSSGATRPSNASGQVTLDIAPPQIKADWNLGAVEDTTSQPGMVLFRRYEGGRHSLRAVLLVTNTPIAGVDPTMLTQALDIARRHATVQWKAGEQGEVRPSPTIRIVGPDFSGATSSIARSIDSWVGRIGRIDPKEVDPMPMPVIHWITGVAQNVVGKLPPTSRAVDGEVGVKLEVESTIHMSSDYFGALLRSIRKATDCESPIAVIAEESSTFGLAATSPEEQGDGKQGDGKQGDADILRFTFPMNISELRRRYQEMEAGRGQSNELRTAERLRLSAAEGAGTGELIRQESSGVSGLSDELRLIQVVREIRRLNIRHAIVQATDVRDTIFLVKFLKSHNPNLQLYSIAPDLALVQQSEMRHVRGLITAGTYPNLLAAQEWTTLVGEGGAVPNVRVSLPSQAAYGVYNAALAHLIEMEAGNPARERELARGLIGYGNPALPSRDDGRRGIPPLWLVVASQHGFFPLAAVDAGSATHQWESPVPFVATDEASRLDPAQARGWLIIHGLISCSLIAFSAVYLWLYARSFVHAIDPRRPWRSRGGDEDDDGTAKEGPVARGGRGARRRPGAADVAPGNLDRRGSILLDDLGLAGLHRERDLANPSDRRRRTTHLIFFVLALIGYATLAVPAWGVEWTQDSLLRLLGAPLFWFTWAMGVFALVAALDAARSRWFSPRSKGRGPLSGTDGADAPAGRTTRRGANPGNTASTAPSGTTGIASGARKGARRDPPIAQKSLYLILFALVATMVLAISIAALRSMQDDFVVTGLLAGDAAGMSPFLARLFGARAVALTSGVSPLLPILIALTALAYLVVNRLRDIWVVRPYRGEWRGGPVPRGLSIALDFFAESLRHVHHDGQASVFGFRRRRGLTMLTLLVISAVGLWFASSWHRDGIASLEPRAVEAVLALGFLGIFAALAGLLLLLTGLWSGLEDVADAAAVLPLGRTFGRLPRHIARRFGNFLKAIQRPTPGPDQDAGGPQSLDSNVVLEPLYQQQASALRHALDRVREEVAKTSTAAASRDSDGPRLDSTKLELLRLELCRPPTSRSGAWIAQACCRLIHPFWEVCTAARACDPPPADATERGKAEARAIEIEMAAYKEEGERALVLSLLDAAETFVAMELARELNRSLTAFWLRVTAVTVLALLLLIYVNSYPFGPSGQMQGIAIGSLAVATVVVVRAIWGFYTNPFIAAVGGRKDSSTFSREMIGRLLTFALPLLLGLGTMLSFAASDLLRALIGPWL